MDAEDLLSTRLRQSSGRSNPSVSCRLHKAALCMIVEILLATSRNRSNS